MSANVEYLEDSTVRVSGEIRTEDLRAQARRRFEWYKKTGKLRIPGFRNKKMTYEQARMLMGKNFLMDESLPIVLERFLYDALDQEYLLPAGNMDLEELVDGEKAFEKESFPIAFTIKVHPTAEVSTCDVKIPLVPREASEQEVSMAIAQEQKRNARLITVEDRGAEMGDIVTIDYAGSIDGVPFEGGSASDHKLELGSGTFIPGFEEGLVGVKNGDHRDLTITFPEDYQASELAGKESVFSVDVKLVQRQELPELDDEFAQDLGGVDTFEEYMAKTKEKLDAQKVALAERQRESYAMQSLLAGTKVEIPQELVDEEVRQQDAKIDEICATNRISRAIYAQYFMQIPENLLPAMMQFQARETVMSTLTLRAVAKMLGLNPTEEEYKAELANEANRLHENPATMEEKYPLARHALTDYLRCQAARKYVIEHAQEEEGYTIPVTEEAGAEA